MKILVLDLVGGMAGDMTAAALLDLGVPLAVLHRGLTLAGLSQVRLEVLTEQRHALRGTRLRMQVTLTDGQTAHEEPRPMPAEAPPALHQDSPGHTHPHTHPHPSPPATHAAATPPMWDHRHPGAHDHTPYKAIRQRLQASELPDGPKQTALNIFARLAQAEGQVHGVAPEDVMFHEVGALDALADVVCVAMALDHLAPEAIYCGPVPLGTGLTRAAHGVIPIPAPATLHLLQGFPVMSGPPAYERTTPTGAAILAAVARPQPPGLVYTPLATGLGLGTLDPPELPNLLRAIWAETTAQAAPAQAAPDELLHETQECTEANLDDANPQWLGYLMERLLAAGALDVVFLPAQMKKNRPGTLVQVLHPSQLTPVVYDLLFAHTPTLGVRTHTVRRSILPRTVSRVQTPWGPVAGKVVNWRGHTRFAPEYEDVVKLAQAHQLPVSLVHTAALKAFDGPDKT